MIDVYTFCCEIYLKKHGLILMNFKMSAINGFEATRKIFEKFENISVLLLRRVYSRQRIYKLFRWGTQCYLFQNCIFRHN